MKWSEGKNMFFKKLLLFCYWFLDFFLCFYLVISDKDIFRFKSKSSDQIVFYLGDHLFPRLFGVICLMLVIFPIPCLLILFFFLFIKMALFVGFLHKILRFSYFLLLFFFFFKVQEERRRAYLVLAFYHSHVFI